MKLVLAGFIMNLALPAYSAVQRTPIYDCVYMGDDSVVESLSVYESKLGRNQFHEVGVRTHNTETFKKVNLVNTYEGRVQTFGTGNFRVKINRVFPIEGKYRTFARIPAYDMHSENWLCKDVF